MRTLYILAATLLVVFNLTQAKPAQPYADLKDAWFGVTTTTPPLVTTTAPDSIAQTSARLNGTVNPRNFSTNANFQYGFTPSYTSSTGTTPMGNGGIPVGLHSTITGLLPHTVYHFRVTANSAQGTANGSDLSFATLAYPPVVAIDTPVLLTYNSARFVALVTPNGATTMAHFDWSTDLSYNHSSSNQNIGSDTVAATVTFDVTGLTPGTDYHVRVVATNSGGTSTSLDMAFHTPNTPPLAVTSTATPIGKTYAILNGSGTTAEVTGTGWFQWGTSVSYNDSTPTSSISTGGSDSFASGLTGLTSGTTYHFRSVVLSGGGIAFGADQYFTTLVSNREYNPDNKTALLLHFDESDRALVQDYSPEANKLSISGTFSYTGLYGRGRVFVAGSDFLEVPADSMLDFATSNFTLEGWVFSNLRGAADFVICNRGSDANNSESYRLTLLRDGNLVLMLNNTGHATDEYTLTTTHAPVPDSAWHHVAAIVDLSKGSATIYVDGVAAPASASGSFPASLYSSNDNVEIGASGAGLTAAERSPSGVSPNVLLDELRISRKARSRAELHVGGAIAGMVFDDANGNSRHDSGEDGLSRWKIVLFKASTNARITAVDSTTSDAAGNYVFDALDPGTYFTREALQDGWIRTLPKGNQFSLITLQAFSYVDNQDYGNVYGCRYIGAPGGAWSNPANWSCGHAPTSDDPIVIPNDTTVSIDGLPSDSINALRIGSGGHLAFGSIAHKLKIHGSVQIDSGGTLTLPGTDDGTGVNCFGDWLNYGNFDPGHSTVIFSGDDPKSIIYAYGSSTEVAKPGTRRRTVQGNVPGNQFYNLQIDGDSTSMNGNITVQNSLALNSDLTAQTTDTVFVVSDSATAVTGTGKLGYGTMSRTVHSGSTGSYRFESSFSTVQFTGSPAFPGTLTETPSADATPRAWQLYWEPVPGTVSLANHTITADHVNHFSKWIVGKPGGTIKPVTIPHIASTETYQNGFDTTSAVRRLYTIGVDANNGSFDATVALRYEPSEIGGLLTEASLQLFRGPIVIDSVQAGWNMVSLPAVPDNASVLSVFPSASSSAFAFTSTYVSASTLSSGTGYWLKFPSARPDSVLGNDNEELTIAVNEGWNLVGALSYQTDVNNISSDDGVTFGTLYGYNHGYFSTTTLIPLHAYWLKANQAGHITIAAPALPGAVTKASLMDGRDKHDVPDVQSEFTSMAKLTITDRIGMSQTLFVGSAHKGDASIFELPPPPPSGVFDARYEDNRIAALASDKGAVDHQLGIRDARYPVKISWVGNAASESAILSTSDGKSAKLIGSGSISVPGPGITISVRTQQSGTANNAALPKEFALHQNYPNPFNPSTDIRFDLPLDAKVTLSVYNVLGQKVATLVDGVVMEAGQHNQTFDASRVASGVYFYSIQAGPFSSIRKMVLLR